MEEKNITVSIVILATRLSNGFKVALNSAINQTLNNKEVIVIGNSSLDEFIPFINKHREKYNVTYYQIDDQISDLNAYLYGVNKSSGEYISFIDGNDYVYNSYLETIIKVMRQDTEIKIATASFKKFSKDKIYGGANYKSEILTGDKKFSAREFSSFRLWNLVVRKDHIYTTMQKEHDVHEYNGMALTVLLLASAQKYYRHGEHLYFRGRRFGSNVDINLTAESIYKTKSLNLPENIYVNLLIDELFIKLLYVVKKNNMDIEKYQSVIKEAIAQIGKIKKTIIFMHRSLAYKKACFAILDNKFDEAYNIILKSDF